ncbi:hypothetical protein J2W51_001955 [Tardiphaga robiniae]|jgi:hypothetical protein|uniref:hypothetical protein n=1 Tax=Tardiphaga robiniae TaxID=943830 RepID=UPI00286490BC|nr:hypothetical protein [Tardiphaga robiniae]MDR6659413.1 hypothetical protein [Tardiphaga robiniae]
MRVEPGDYEVLVNSQRTAGTYADLNVAIDIAVRLHKSNAPHTITVRSISTGVTVWPTPAS